MSPRVNQVQIDDEECAKPVELEAPPQDSLFGVRFPVPDAMTQNRYLHFSNIDIERPDISSECSRCGREFTAEPKPGERVNDVLLRVRAEFEAHTCPIPIRRV